MNVVDSSAWLEYFADGLNAKFFAKPIEDTEHLIVPTLCLFEVFKKVLSFADESRALQVVAAMQQGIVVELGSTLVIDAAKISLELGLPMADSIILSTTRVYKAILWTQDADFKGLPDVRYHKKRS